MTLQVFIQWLEGVRSSSPLDTETGRVEWNHGASSLFLCASAFVAFSASPLVVALSCVVTYVTLRVHHIDASFTCQNC